MRRPFPVVLSLLAVLALTGCSHGIHSVSGGRPPASASSPFGVSSSADVVKVSSPEVKIPANGSGEAVVILSVSPGFHINANPATFPYLIPTELHTGRAEGIHPGKPAYPVAQKKRFQFAEQPLAVYEGDVQIKLPFRAEANLPKGSGWLPISVTVQACDNEKCYSPATLNAMIRWT